MRRLGSGLVAVALLFVAIGLGLSDPQPVPAARRVPERADAETVERAPAVAPTRISLYGDSLAHQARPAFVAELTRRGPEDRAVSTRPGAALCDDRDVIMADLLLRRPQVIVLEYSGNSFTGCMRDAAGTLLEIGSAGWLDRYVDDLRAVLTVAGVTDTSVVWATAPPVRHAPDPENYPRRIAKAVRKLATKQPLLRVVDTGAALATAEGSFAPDLPCRSDERVFCLKGRIPSRAADGLHFDCHGTVDVLGGCEGYSAGGRRFGEAMADAALATRRDAA